MSVLAAAAAASDLSDIAAATAICFCRARCAGLDIRPIAPVARAAITLGADAGQLYADAPPHACDADYLDELLALRAWLRQKIAQLADIYEEAYRQYVMAIRMLRAARDESTRALALRLIAEAIEAMDLCYETAMRCYQAGRLLLEAGIDFRLTYEQTEATVADGHQLPYDGRWITGQTQAPQERDKTASPV